MKRAPNARWTRIFGLAGLLTLLRRVRRRADAKELAIESREQLFSMLVRNADDIYVMFSPDAYEVEYVSPNVEKLLGVSVEAVKNNIRALSDSAADPSSDPRIDDIASLEEGECLQVFRERIQARTGERRWYQETLYRESIKGVDKYVLVLSDRTNEQKGSLMLEQALDIARSSNEAKSQFLANMSHDIRTPINAIVGMTKIARESGEASEKIAGCLDAITASSRHLLELINDVLDMSRIESGQMELQERRFDIDDVVGGVEAIIRPQAQAKSQELRIDCSKMKHKADPFEPCVQCGEVHAGGRHHSPRRAGAGENAAQLCERCFHDNRRRHGHVAGIRRAYFRSVRAQRRGVYRADTGNRVGDVHNEGADRRHGRHCRGRQRTRKRQLVSRDIGTSRRLVGGCLSAA